MSALYRNPAATVLEHAAETPKADAVVAAGERLTYADLAASLQAVAAHLTAQGIGPGDRVAIDLARSPDAYAAILGVLATGAAFIPLDADTPERIKSTQIAAAEPKAVLTAETCRVLPKIGFEPIQPSETDTAYVMFTSGTTGVPKGVMVSFAALEAFRRWASSHFRLAPTDRLSQFFRLSFDLSLFDQFVCWDAGAVLYPVPDGQTLAAAKFIRENRLTLWFSVPSAGLAMQQLGQLKADAFPDLKQVLFCGEPLPKALAAAWAAAAPNAEVWNLYGPTEATIACLIAAATDAPITTNRDWLAIGKPVADMRAKLSDDGQLLLSGPQLAQGYWRDDPLTDARFKTIEGERWYVTGDLADQGPNGEFHFLGRNDHQIKLRGHRLELEAVEAAVRDRCTAPVVCLVRKNAAELAEDLICLVEAETVDEAAIKATLRGILPPQALPSRIQAVARLPRAASGKIDRAAAAELLPGTPS